jgi:hypothetical protein
MLTLYKYGPFLYKAGHKRFYEAANGKIGRAEPFVLRLGRVERVSCRVVMQRYSGPIQRALNKDSPENARRFPSTHPIV